MPTQESGNTSFDFPYLGLHFPIPGTSLKSNTLWMAAWDERSEAPHVSLSPVAMLGSMAGLNAVPFSHFQAVYIIIVNTHLI